MIRILIKALTPLSYADLEQMLVTEHDLIVVDESFYHTAGDIPDSTPDVTIVELDPHDGDIREMLDEYAAGGSPIVGILDEDAPAGLASMLGGNVRALLRKQITSDELVAAVRAAAAGLFVLQPESFATHARAVRAQPAHLIQPLTPRERDVLEYMADGISNKEIGSRLDISDHTVKFHVASIMSKLDAATRTEAVTIAIRSGLLMV